MGETVADARAGESVCFRERAQGDDVVVAVVHGIGVAVVVLGVLEVGFVEDDENSLGNVRVEGFEFLAGEDGAGRVIGIGQVDDFRLVVDGGGQRGEIVVPVCLRDGAVGYAARAGQDFETGEGGLRGEDFVVVAEEGADDVGHDALRAAADDDVFDFDIVLLGQDAAKVDAAVRVAVEAVEVVSDCFDGEGGGTERVFVRREFDDAGDAELALYLLDAEAGEVRREGRDVGRD